jgi:flagellar FliL protein
MAKAEQEPPEAAATPKPAKAASAWPPLIAVLVLMPAVAYATTQFLILPKIRGAMTEQKLHAASGKAPEQHADKAAKFSYDFDNLVVNLAGSMGTKYLKASFTLLSSHENLKKIIDENKKKLLDTAINVLSSHTMVELEAAGAKNVLRNALIASFNQALHSDLIEQLYYSDFVIQ